MATTTVKIDGMSCSHCVKAVTMALQDLPGVDVRDVKIGEAVIDADETVVTAAQIAAAIDEAGFRVTGTTAASQ